MRARRWIVSFGLPLILLACGKDDTGPAVLCPDCDPLPVETIPDWSSVETTMTNWLAIIERVAYESEGLEVLGQVCRPPDDRAHPVVVVNHGGASGLGSEWGGGVCFTLAQYGFVVIESSYRGEDGSEGPVEVCQGEVDDVLNMLDIVLHRPYADSERVVMAGLSHGGCITMRALARGAPVHVAVNIFGPADWADAYNSWQIEAAKPETPAATRTAYQSLSTIVLAGIGGTPDEVPEEYARRSPINEVEEVQAFPGALLMMLAVEDELVPMAQGCEFASRSGDFEMYHLDVSANVVNGPPSGCEAYDLAWQSQAIPYDWPSNRYWIAYDGIGHSAQGDNGINMLGDLLAFVWARLP